MSTKGRFFPHMVDICCCFFPLRVHVRCLSGLDSEPVGIILSRGGRSIHHLLLLLQYAPKMMHWQLADVGQFYRPE